METINKVSEIVGLTRRVIQEYEKAGLAIKPEKRNKYGHLLYDEKEIERLWQLHFYKELGYDKKKIRDIVENPDYDRHEELRNVIQSLIEKREHLDHLIAIAQGLQNSGTTFYSFKSGIPGFDKMNFDELFQLLGTMFSAFGGIVEEDVLWEEILTDERSDAIFDSFELVMHYCEKGKSCFSEEVQSQIDLIHDIISKAFSGSICIFACFALGFAPGSEVAAEIDMDYGQGRADYFYKALQYYCREHEDNPVDRELDTLSENIIRLGKGGSRADSEEVQLEVGKIYHFFQKWDTFPKKVRFELFKNTGKLCGSKAYINIFDRGRKRGVYWFLSRAIQIYCDRLKVQGVEEGKREEGRI